MKVLRVVTLASSSGKYGGPYDTASRQVQLAKGLGYEAQLLAGMEKSDSGIRQVNSIESLLVPVRRALPGPGFTGMYSTRMFLAQFKNIFRADIVHISIARELVPLSALAIALLLKKTVIVQPHGMLTSRRSLLHTATDVILKPLVQHANSVVALTQREASELTAHFTLRENQVSILGNPIPSEAEAYLGVRKHKPEALFIARLHPRKRVGDFIAAATFAQRATWADKYVAIGPDGGELKLVEQKASTLENFEYQGSLPGSEVTSRLAESRVFVLTSEDEPWGNVLATALAIGTPVIVPKSAALSELIKDYGAGIVYEDGKIEELASAVHVLLVDDATYDKSRKGALELAKCHLNRRVLKEAINSLYTYSLSIQKNETSHNGTS